MLSETVHVEFMRSLTRGGGVISPPTFFVLFLQFLR